MIHLTPQQLSSYMDGELSEVSTELVRRHMERCEECTLKFASLEEQEERLSSALVHEPGDEFFDRFAADVERQLPPGKESRTRRGSTSAASRAAALREAAREAALDAAHDAARRAGRGADRSATFPDVEAEADLVPASRQQAAASPASAKSMADVEPDFDEEAAMAELLGAEPVASPPIRPRAAASDRPLPKAPPLPVDRSPSLPPARPAPARPTPARPAPRPVQRGPKTRRPVPSIPWYAAIILVVIAGAAGVVVSRLDPVSAWLDVHRGLIPNAEQPAGVDPAPPTAPKEGASTAHVAETPPRAGTQSDEETRSGEVASGSDDSDPITMDYFEPEPQAAERFLTPQRPASRASGSPGGKDPFAGLPAASIAQVRAAQRSKAAADANPSADRYEAAADAWEQTIPLLRGVGQQSLGRLELASSRYRAWEHAPTEGRAASAAVAIRTYLALAPQGAPRVMAREWLARVSR